MVRYNEEVSGRQIIDCIKNMSWGASLPFPTKVQKQTDSYSASYWQKVETETHEHFKKPDSKNKELLMDEMHLTCPYLNALSQPSNGLNTSAEHHLAFT